MKKALICLEQLGIGGVETFTIAQVEEFTRRNIKCYVLARNGILSEKIKKIKNTKFIEFDFELKNEIDFKKIESIEKLIVKEKIDFIYVHQFSCVPYILPIAFKQKIPYVAYLHNIVPGTLNWFMDNFSIYKELFPIYFNNASKIIAITEKVKLEHQQIFKIDNDKYIIIKNSLDFSKFPDVEIQTFPKKFKKLLLFGRISEQKRQSIYTAVDFYNYCKNNYNKNMKLTVVGDGEIFEEIKEKYKDTDIYFKGAVSDINSEIKKADILLGVDRCMLEAIASKKPSVICGYKNNVVLITPDNLIEAIEENFGGYSLKNDKDEILTMNHEKLKKILEDNYKYIEKNLSISNSVYLDIDKFPNLIDEKQFFQYINESTKKVEMLKNDNKILEEKIDAIINSKRWKILNRILKIIDKLRVKKEKEEGRI